MAAAAPVVRAQVASTRGLRVQGMPRHGAKKVLSIALEIGLVLALLSLYRLGRSLASGHIQRAEGNASHLWHLERVLHLPDEADVQNLILHSRFLVECANQYYVTVHFPLTGVFLIWLLLRHRSSYHRVRNTLVLLTFSGLVFTVLMPLAPPRLFIGDSLIDTMQVVGPSAYNPDSTSGVANQYAAMPSLHIAWAVLVGVTIVRVSNSRLRYLAVMHPVITVFVVVATGNHYWLDGFVGLALLALSAMFVYRVRWITATAALASGLRSYSVEERRLHQARLSAAGPSGAIHLARRAVVPGARGIGPPSYS